MMTSSFTPGPWFHDGAPRQRDGAIGVFAEQGVACVALIEAGCLPLDDDGRDARWANAALIASSPDLLSALENLIPRFVACAIRSGSDEEDAERAVAMHRAAVKAARGL